MKYFIDTEFYEYHKQQKCLSIKIGKPIPTIDLISIGIVSEDGKEYYAISKDFNIKDAWYSNQGTKEKSNYWLRENVLKPIFNELKNKVYEGQYGFKIPFILKNFKHLINKYGKTNKQIVDDIRTFVYIDSIGNGGQIILGKFLPNKINSIEFYAYYADYDWVVFAQLFGKMIDLPEGFPMFAFDIQQLIIDNNIDKDELLKVIPQKDIHNSLQDAIWNKKAFNYINNIKDEKRKS